jgi:hypothetical protein
MKDQLKRIALGIYAVLFGVLVVLGIAGSTAGGAIARYLRRRDAAERRAKDAADEALTKLNGEITQANGEVRDDSLDPARTINRR